MYALLQLGYRCQPAEFTGPVAGSLYRYLPKSVLRHYYFGKISGIFAFEEILFTKISASYMRFWQLFSEKACLPMRNIPKDTARISDFGKRADEIH